MLLYKLLTKCIKNMDRVFIVTNAVNYDGLMYHRQICYHNTQKIINNNIKLYQQEMNIKINIQMN